MKTSSMTGFGKAEEEKDGCSLRVEVKSVNNRFKDIRFKLPNTLSHHDPMMRKEINERFKRGSFEISALFRKNQSELGIKHIDYNKVNSYINDFCEQTKLDRKSLNLSPSSFLRNEFFKEEESLIDDLFIPAFQKAVNEFEESRQEEGSKLADVLKNYINEYEQYFFTVKDKKEGFKSILKEKLQERFKEFKETIDDERRFSQEMVYYLEKADIDEEIIRIESHLEKLRDLIDQGGEVGRKIDFFIQELNRETNTIGSKSISKEVSNSVIEMKSKIEKIREQALNLE